MIIVKLIGIAVILLYVLFLLYGAVGYLKLPAFQADPNSKTSTKTCIIICARNEEKTIAACLNSILEQNFDTNLLELILVNDASTDNTLNIAETILKQIQIPFQIISNAQQEGKKRSITAAIELCNSDLIITRDADTYTTNSNWLKTIVSFFELSKAEFIIAPVDIEPDNSFLGSMQSFENDALCILTAGFAANKKAFLCNGANLAFSKNIFQKVKGYSSHQNIASGDDVLFLEDVKKIAPEKIKYLKQKEALVYTYPLKKTSALLNQKLRWASKFDSNPNQLNQILGILVFLCHVYTVFFMVKGLFSHHLPVFGLFFVLMRFFIDFLLLFLASRYYKKAIFWWWLLPVWAGYSFFVLSVGILSWFYKPKWK